MYINICTISIFEATYEETSSRTSSRGWFKADIKLHFIWINNEKIGIKFIQNIKNNNSSFKFEMWTSLNNYNLTKTQRNSRISSTFKDLNANRCNFTLHEVIILAAKFSLNAVLSNGQSNCVYLLGIKSKTHHISFCCLFSSFLLLK